MILVCNTTASMTIVIKEIHLHMIILISFLSKISAGHKDEQPLFSFHYFPLSIDHPCPIKEVLSPIKLNSLLAASNYPKLRLPDAALYPLFLFDENDDDDDDLYIMGAVCVSVCYVFSYFFFFTPPPPLCWENYFGR